MAFCMWTISSAGLPTKVQSLMVSFTVPRPPLSDGAVQQLGCQMPVVDGVEDLAGVDAVARFGDPDAGTAL